MQGTWQALHLVKRCNDCRVSYMYGYNINTGRMKEYDTDCLTRRALGEWKSLCTTLRLTLVKFNF